MFACDVVGEWCVDSDEEDRGVIVTVVCGVVDGQMSAGIDRHTTLRPRRLHDRFQTCHVTLSGR